jgi:hypothetical protein
VVLECEPHSALYGKTVSPLSHLVSFGTEPEVEGVALRIYSSIQILPDSLDSDIRFIDAPGIIGGTQMGTASLVNFCPIVLHPAVKCRMVNLHPSFEHHLLNIPITQGIAAIPPNRLQNDLW